MKPAALLQRHALLVLVLALIALRLGTLLTSVERVSYEEELYRGTIAKELVDGLKGGLWEYQADAYQGGSLVIGLLAAPLFRALGPRLVVLKLVPLAFAVATLVLLFAFLRRFFGPAAAVIGGIAYVLAPPGPTYMSLIAMGFHTESVVFSVLMLLGWYGFVWGTRRRAAWLGLFGLAAGGGISFTYITGLTALGCAASAVVLRPARPGRRGVVALAVGLVIGLLPWALYNATHAFAGLGFAASVFSPLADADGSIAGVLGRVARKVVVTGALALPESYGFPRIAGIPGRVLSYVYYLAAVLLVGRLVTHRRATAWKVLPLLLILVLFVVAYALSWYSIPRAGQLGDLSRFHYFAPVHLVIVALVAVAIAEASGRDWLLAVFVALGLAGQSTMLFNEPPGRALRYRGYSYFSLGQLWQPKLSPGSARLTEATTRLAAFDPTERRAVARGMFSDGPGWAGLVPMTGRVDQIDAVYRTYVAEVIGAAVGERASGGADEIAGATRAMSDDERAHFYSGYSGASVWRHRRSLSEYLSSAATVDPRYRFLFYKALGGMMVFACHHAEYRGACQESSRIARGLSPEVQAWVYRGAGAFDAPTWIKTPALYDRHAREFPIPDEHSDDFVWGVGWGLRRWHAEDRVRALDWIARLGPSARVAALAGARACEAWHGLETVRDGERTRP